MSPSRSTPAPDVAPATAEMIDGYATLQFSVGGLFDGRTIGQPIHLVRRVDHGTPGPTLCGIDRFAKGGPGWSVRGGIQENDATSCRDCDAARDHSLTVDGMFARLFVEPSR